MSNVKGMQTFNEVCWSWGPQALGTVRLWGGRQEGFSTSHFGGLPRGLPGALGQWEPFGRGCHEAHRSVGAGGVCGSVGTLWKGLRGGAGSVGVSVLLASLLHLPQKQPTPRPWCSASSLRPWLSVSPCLRCSVTAA